MVLLYFMSYDCTVGDLLPWILGFENFKGKESLINRINFWEN